MYMCLICYVLLMVHFCLGVGMAVLPLLALLDLISYFLSLLQLTELIYKQLLFLFFLFCLLNNMVIQNN